MITVTKPKPAPPHPPPVVRPERPAAPEPKPEPKPPAPEEAPPRYAGKLLGITTKFMLYILVPLILIYGFSIFFSIQKMTETHNITIKESSRMITQASEKSLVEHARAVAIQVQLYLKSRPNLKKQEFEKDVNFRRVAVQRVGLTGYSALYELPDENGVWRTWAHTNPKIIGIDMSKLKKPMGRNFAGFWKVYTGVKGGRESQGYYTWQEKDGTFREKFMVCTPVEGTRFIVASTTYLDEFTMPVKRLENITTKLGNETRITNAVLMGAGLILIALIIFFYGRSLTGKITHLSDVADRICVGELDAEVKIKSKDEIGELGNAIARMQDSIRVSIERLRRRRGV
jgi:HAMP domain-containing protein